MHKTNQIIQSRVQVKGSERVQIILLWSELRLLVSNMHIPMPCMGDFSAMLTGNDRLHGNPV